MSVIVFFCARCGSPLEVERDGWAEPLRSLDPGDVVVPLTPCAYCLEKAKRSGSRVAQGIAHLLGSAKDIDAAERTVQQLLEQADDDAEGGGTK